MSAILRKPSSAKWIALSRGTNNKVVGTGNTVKEALETARRNGEGDPFIIKSRRRRPPLESAAEIPGGILWQSLPTTG